ncbi:MAG: iron-sulfur cluster assembly scaffold protein [Deltaproteobacteria bacterium HGW-Deltaproteobacteria-12]|jgi:nitrogen fixation NifU-like protein|nr:MAG: iron-sulfur cluster assembly scaffold protein [Deltaproteobacteria bacterium HGW-Deltaproteobacteria-12]
MDDAVYNNLIISLSKELKYAGQIDCPDCEATLNNPLCGDRVTIQICVADKHIIDFRHQVRGCILCKASASLLASRACGMTLMDIIELRKSLTEVIKPKSEEVVFQACHEIFRPVRKHRSRHSCVLLPYDASIQALSSLVVHDENRLDVPVKNI